jgi:hypothetical protein
MVWVNWSDTLPTSVGNRPPWTPTTSFMADRYRVGWRYVRSAAAPIVTRATRTISNSLRRMMAR